MSHHHEAHGVQLKRIGDMEQVMISCFMGSFLLCAILVLDVVLKVSGNAEGEALNALKNSLSDPNSVLQSWDSTLVSPCAWYGVNCSSDNSVTSVDLGNANLSGTLVPQLGQLPNLQYLRLDSNSLSGDIPMVLTAVGSLQVLDLSNNQLTGNIPVNGSFSSFAVTCFKNNPGLKLTYTPAPPPETASVLVGKSSTGAIAGEVVAGAALLFAAPAIALVYWRRKKPQDYFFDVSAEEDPEVHLHHCKKFSLLELQVATDNFSSENILGRGGSAKVYKGCLADGSLVAVKRLEEAHFRFGELQFQTEVKTMTMAVHCNLVRLQGICLTPNEKMLVYPFMPNGSVASWLHDRPESQPPLDWPKRKGIALGSARGLAHLHDHCDPKIIHRDVKPHNILLDEDFEAVVVDFGIARLVDYKDIMDNEGISTRVCGTPGYIAPEYISTGIASERIDVYGYGVMLHELITGRRVIELRLDDDKFPLLDWVKRLMKDKRLETLVDADLGGNYDEEELEQLIQVALLCTQISPAKRPKMSEVVRMLKGDGLAEKWDEWQKDEMNWQVDRIFDST